MAPLFNMAPVVQAMATGTYTVVRRALDTVSNGVVVDGATTAQDVRASIQPEGGAQVRSPGGTWAPRLIMVFAVGLSSAFCTTKTTSAPRKADRITYLGLTYEAVEAFDWQEAGGFSQALFEQVDAAVQA